MTLYPAKWSSKFELKKGVWVFVPSQYSIGNGFKIKNEIEKHWKPPVNFNHLAKGGHILALKKHLGNTQFIHLDIKRFYDSINRSRITRCTKLYLGYKRAREITIQSTVTHPTSKPKKFILPFGFIQSPILASLCLSMSSLGLYLQKISKKRNFAVSIYMDDIIVSSPPKYDLSLLLKEIKEVATKSKFTLNSTKEEGPASKITAFNIHLSHKDISIEKARLEEFSEAYNNSESEYQREGILSYIESVNPKQIALL